METTTVVVVGAYTGQAYTVYRHETLGCWTYRDVRGYGPGLGYDRDRHATPEGAAKAALFRDILRAAEGDWSGLDRAAYEALAARLDLPVTSDADLELGGRRSYSVRYGEFSSPEYPMAVCAEMALAKRRQKAIEAAAERREAKRTLPAPERLPWGARGVRYDEACAACGTETVIDNDRDVCKRCAGG